MSNGDVVRGAEGNDGKKQARGLLGDGFLSLVPLVTVSMPVRKERGRTRGAERQFSKQARLLWG